MPLRKEGLFYMSKDCEEVSVSPTHLESNSERRAQAQKAHTDIVDCSFRLGEDWVSLTRRVQEFKKAKLYRYIEDPDNGKCFTRFDRWAEFALGKSASTIFSHLQILKELTGVIADDKLPHIPRQTALQLIRHKKENKNIDQIATDDAERLTAAEFAERHPVTSITADPSEEPRIEQLGPFKVSPETLDLFKRALKKAKRAAGRLPAGEREDAALASMADAYLANHPIPARSALPVTAADQSTGTLFDQVM